MSNYPLGAEDDPRAPYNQVDLPERELEVWASNTLSRAALIKVRDYKVLPPDVERDEEGHVTYYKNIDYSECNLKEQFQHQCYTVKELFNCLQMTIADINAHGLTSQNLQMLNRLSREFEYWTVDEEEVVQA